MSDLSTTMQDGAARRPFGADALFRRSGDGGRGVPEPPPVRIPGEHFAAGLVFLVAGAAGLVWRAESLAAGAFSDPGLLATAHLFTLGWIGTSLMGALYQFLPVALGSGIRWERLTHLTFGLWVCGVVVLVTGFAITSGGLLTVGGVVLGAATLCFTANLVVTLWRAEGRGVTWWCVAGSTLALLGAWVLGLLLALNLSSGVLGASRLSVLAIHVHLAAGGWVLLSVVGLAHRLMSLFLPSGGAGQGLGTAAAVLLGAATVALLVTGHGLPVAALPFALGLMGAGAAAFLLQALRYFRRRRRPIEPGMRLVGGALALLAMALTTGAILLVAPGADASLLTAYGLLLVPGGLGLLVAGSYYEIVPLVTWFHRFRPMAAEREIPGAGVRFDHRAARIAGSLMTAGVLAMAAGAVAETGIACLAGAVAYAGGALTQSAHMLAIARRRP